MPASCVSGMQLQDGVKWQRRRGRERGRKGGAVAQGRPHALFIYVMREDIVTQKTIRRARIVFGSSTVASLSPYSGRYLACSGRQRRGYGPRLVICCPSMRILAIHFYKQSSVAGLVVFQVYSYAKDQMTRRIIYCYSNNTLAIESFIVDPPPPTTCSSGPMSGKL